MQDESAIKQIEAKHRSLASVLDERGRRHWAATEVGAYGWGGVSAVGAATGMSPNTIRKELAELAARERGLILKPVNDCVSLAVVARV